MKNSTTKLISSLTVIFIFMLQVACKKGDQIPSNNPLSDSLYLLKSFPGATIEYDANNNVYKLISAYQPTSFFTVYYNSDGKIRNIMYQFTDVNNSIVKNSLIVQYDANGNWKKVIYKNPQSGSIYSNDNNSYYTNINDGQVNSYDTLIYSSTNQITEYCSYFNSSQINSKLKFSYPSLTDSVANKIEYFQMNGTPYVTLNITQSIYDNPVNTSIWYYIFVQRLGYISQFGGNPFSPLPYLFAGYALNYYVNSALSFVKKLPSTYSIIDGGSLKNFPSTFTYNSIKQGLDSTLISSAPAWLTDKNYYSFRKTKRK